MKFTNNEVLPEPGRPKNNVVFDLLKKSFVNGYSFNFGCISSSHSNLIFDIFGLLHGIIFNIYI
jgi:hypothetical protein